VFPSSPGFLLLPPSLDHTTDAGLRRPLKFSFFFPRMRIFFPLFFPRSSARELPPTFPPSLIGGLLSHTHLYRCVCVSFCFPFKFLFSFLSGGSHCRLPPPFPTFFPAGGPTVLSNEVPPSLPQYSPPSSTLSLSTPRNLRLVSEFHFAQNCRDSLLPPY